MRDARDRAADRSGRRARGPRREGGFALVEVIIALAVLLILLLGIGLEMTAQYSSMASSRNEQTAEGVLGRALNEVRGLPFVDVAKGLSNKDTTATGTTTYIERTGTNWKFTDTALAGQGTGELVAHYTPKTATPPPPLYPHVSTTARIDAVSYTVRTFPTKYQSYVATTAGKKVVKWVEKPVYRVIVVVTWRANGRGGPTTLVGQTLVYSKTSTCKALTSTSDPFAAPCQPNFTATAFAGNGAVALTRLTTASAATPLHGLSFTSMGLVLPGASTTSTLTQTSSVVGSAQASGVELVPQATTDQVVRVLTKASDDPASGAGTYQQATLSGSASPVTKTSTTGSYAVTVSPSTGDAGTSVSTTSAKTAQPCDNLAGSPQTTSLPCGAGRAVQNASSSIAATLGPLGSTPLAQVTATTAHPDQVFSARYPKTHGPGTPTAPSCPSTAAVGCIYSAAEGGLGTVQLAGLPAQVLADAKAPAGWTSDANFLLRLSGYSAEAWTWAQSVKTPGGWLRQGGTEPLSGSDPQLTWYTATAKADKTTTLTGGTQTVAIPKVTFTDTSAPGGAATVTIAATVTTTATTSTPTISTPKITIGRNGPAADTTTPATLKKAHISRWTVSSPISAVSASLTYKVTQGTTVLADFGITVNLGAVAATASYQVAS